MMVEVREEGGIPVAGLSGEIDGRTAPAVQESLLPWIEKYPKLVLDMREVSFLSSAGLRMMLLLYRAATACQGRLALVGLSEQIRDVMAATGFLHFFVVENDAASAWRAMG